jgi:catalase-peroxidase
MGPKVRYLGPEVPAEDLIWQDPVPAVDHPLIDAADIAALKAKILASGLSVRELVSTAWASASTFRGSDKRGGANGARIRLAPQKDWAVNQPAQLARVLACWKASSKEFNAAQTGGKRVSLADLIVLGGCAAVEAAAKRPVTRSRCPSRRAAPTPRRNRPTCRIVRRARTEADGFRNYQKRAYTVPAEALLVDKAQLLTLSAPEMTVLVGGLRVLGANTGRSRGTACSRACPDAEQRLLRQPARHGHGVEARVRGRRPFEGRDRKTGR